jgi:hypothetical protein
MGQRNRSNSATQIGAGDALTALTYRSRAVEPMSEPGLRGLEQQSQERNRLEGLTGLAYYDNGRFFQWLEGPADAVSRVWESVRRDPRHTDIEGVSVLTTPARIFSGWDMRLSVRGPASKTPPAVPPPPELLQAALSAIDLEAVLLKDPATEIGKTPKVVPVIPLVAVLVEAVVLPALLSQKSAVRRFLPRTSPDAARLARLLLADDVGPAAALVRDLHARAGSLAPLCATLIEPAARGLGDLWSTDDCSEIAMTLALSRLQYVVHELAHGSARAAIAGRVVLVAPQPGEGHSLGAALSAELLTQAGWQTHAEFPATNEALRAMVADTWFDVLDLSLSPAMCREESLSVMAETIAGARSASRNPALTVVVGGRDFFENAGASETVGADASTSSALHVVLAMTRAVQKTLARQAELGVLVTSS